MISEKLKNFEGVNYIIDVINGDEEVVEEPEFDDSDESKTNKSEETSSFNDFCDDCLPIILTLFFGILLAFETIHSSFALYKTPTSIIDRKCDNNYIWYYLLSSTTIYKFCLYIMFKSLPFLDELTDFLYILPFINISSFVFFYFGDKSINDQCIISNFEDTKLYTLSYYHTNAQKIIIIMSLSGSIILCRMKYRKKKLIKNNKLNRDVKKSQITKSINNSESIDKKI